MTFTHETYNSRQAGLMHTVSAIGYIPGVAKDIPGEDGRELALASFRVRNAHLLTNTKGER